MSSEGEVGGCRRGPGHGRCPRLCSWQKGAEVAILFPRFHFAIHFRFLRSRFLRTRFLRSRFLRSRFLRSRLRSCRHFHQMKLRFDPLLAMQVSYLERPLLVLRRPQHRPLHLGLSHQPHGPHRPQLGSYRPGDSLQRPLQS